MGTTPRGRKAGTGATKPRNTRGHKRPDAAAADSNEGGASSAVVGRPAGTGPLDAWPADAPSVDTPPTDTRAPASEGHEDDAPTSHVELPYIVDPPPRATPPVTAAVVDDREQTPDDVWVDQVLASAPKAPASRRATPGGAGGAVRSRPPAPSRPAAKSPSPLPSPSQAPKPATRWWLVAPVFAGLAMLLWVNRPGQRHAPVPAGLLGTWTTTFWLYENQTMQILRDTVVVTLDEPEMGRYPITTVETADAGRETAVKIGYRLDSGEEKTLDFLADKAPTTALRFRNHSGLVWVRAVE